MTAADFTSQQASKYSRFRRALTSVLFAPVGRFNILALLGATAVETMLLFLVVSGTWMDSTIRTWLVITATVPVIAGVIHFARTFDAPFTEEQRKRVLIAESGSLNPTRIIKNHPERVTAYQRLIKDTGSANSVSQDSDAFQNASELVLAGKLTEDDIHFITAAIQQGAVTTTEIETAVAVLRRNSIVPLLDGLL